MKRSRSGKNKLAADLDRRADLAYKCGDIMKLERLFDELNPGDHSGKKWYCAREDDCLATIAGAFQLDEAEVVKKNEWLYPGIDSRKVLEARTIIRIYDAKEREARDFREGDRVLCQWKIRKEMHWLPAEVLKIHPNGSADLRWTDASYGNSVSKRVAKSRIRRQFRASRSSSSERRQRGAEPSTKRRRLNPKSAGPGESSDSQDNAPIVARPPPPEPAAEIIPKYKLGKFHQYIESNLQELARASIHHLGDVFKCIAKTNEYAIKDGVKGNLDDCELEMSAISQGTAAMVCNLIDDGLDIKIKKSVVRMRQKAINKRAEEEQDAEAEASERRLAEENRLRELQEAEDARPDENEEKQGDRSGSEPPAPERTKLARKPKRRRRRQKLVVTGT